MKDWYYKVFNKSVQTSPWLPHGWCDCTTFKELACQCFTIGLMVNQVLFLSPKPKWKKNDDVWFTTSLIDHNQLQLIIDGLTYDFPILKTKVSSNKIG